MDSQLSPDIVEAYRRAHYRVEVPGKPFVLKVDEPSSELQALLEPFKGQGAAVITPDNPGSQKVPDAQNLKAREDLTRILQEKKLQSYLGWNEDPSGSWPAERSFLILGISLEDAKNLANRSGQNAFLWSGPDGTPHLTLLR